MTRIINKIKDDCPLKVFDEYTYLISASMSHITSYAFKFPNNFGAFVMVDENTWTTSVDPLIFVNDYMFDFYKDDTLKAKNFKYWTDIINYVNEIKEYKNGTN